VTQGDGQRDEIKEEKGSCLIDPPERIDGSRTDVGPEFVGEDGVWGHPRCCGGWSCAGLWPTTR
jgi:hypothetical protein